MRSEKINSVHECKDCGDFFVSNPSAKYCPECRRIRKNAITAKWRKFGPERKLGSISKCEACGKEYVVEGGRQRYCKECSDSQIKANIAIKKKQAYKENGINRNFEKTRICPSCNKSFSLSNNQKYCSDECREYGKYFYLAKRCLRDGKRKSEPLSFVEWKNKHKS